MLKGFLNHGCVIVNDLLLGTCMRVHTVSFPARRARFRRSAGHTTKVMREGMDAVWVTGDDVEDMGKWRGTGSAERRRRREIVPIKLVLGPIVLCSGCLLRGIGDMIVYLWSERYNYGWRKFNNSNSSMKKSPVLSVQLKVYLFSEFNSRHVICTNNHCLLWHHIRERYFTI